MLIDDNVTYYRWDRRGGSPIVTKEELAQMHADWRVEFEAKMYNYENIALAGQIILDLFAIANGGDDPGCRVLDDPMGAALDWLKKWREVVSCQGNTFTGRWMVEGPPPWPDDGHLPKSDPKC